VKKKIVCFDLDNTLCKTQQNFYKKSIPIKKNIEFTNYLYDKGYYIKIFTSRFMGRSNENIILSKKKGYSFTKKQLMQWGVKYHKLIFGKPSYDILIDDKCLFYSKHWISKLNKALFKRR